MRWLRRPRTRRRDLPPRPRRGRSVRALAPRHSNSASSFRRRGEAAWGFAVFNAHYLPSPISRADRAVPLPGRDGSKRVRPFRPRSPRPRHACLPPVCPRRRPRPPAAMTGLPGRRRLRRCPRWSIPPAVSGPQIWPEAPGNLAFYWTAHRPIPNVGQPALDRCDLRARPLSQFNSSPTHRRQPSMEPPPGTASLRSVVRRFINPLRTKGFRRSAASCADDAAHPYKLRVSTTCRAASYEGIESIP